MAVAVGVGLVLVTAGLAWVAWGDLPASVERPELPPGLFVAFSETVRGVKVSRAVSCLHAEERVIDAAQLDPKRAQALEFALPDDAALRTRLWDSRSWHGELLFEGKRPGLDVARRFVLPIY